jgi:hypothetical protein
LVVVKLIYKYLILNNLENQKYLLITFVRFFEGLKLYIYEGKIVHF